MMMRITAIVSALIAVLLGATMLRADTFGGAVSSVNGQTGTVALPVYQRQVSVPMPVSTSDGTVTWTYPTAFISQPTCFYSLGTSSTTSNFDFPAVTSISTTSVSLLVTSHAKQMSVLSLTLPIVLQLASAGVPTGTTITFSCLAPM